MLKRSLRVSRAASEVRGHVTIGQTKTGKSRAVSMPPLVVDELAAHLAAFPPGPDGLVFTAAEGGTVRRTNLRRRVWAPTLQRAGLADPQPRIHDLRHTCASLAIAYGGAAGHPKQISAMLGHSSISITMDRYGHLFLGMAQEVADLMGEAYGAAVPQMSPTEPEPAPVVALPGMQNAL